MDLFYDSMAVFVSLPWLAAVPALGFALLWWRNGGVVVALAALAWALYGLYEGGIYLRLLCTGDCNIRVDLIFAYPPLAALTLLAGWRGLRGRW
ncbi:hypothetical protein M1105_10895 [Limibaculum sp. FT325]|uniref:hypothetical protein n=1 Tax=Thermohalobaculum sediminis TaxID=2939436 RepID=UPI0020C127BE|nr:hypothetical protein [Limibaculum sediminis]MCL5777490.1 hypothetical protein [Limibaculum sediminis]